MTYSVVGPKITAVRGPSSDLLSLSIVLPCYREEANVERVVRDAVAVGRRVARDLEVIVVDDGSDDDTGLIARRLAAEIQEVRVVGNRRNVGYGGALALGFRSATKDWIFYTDGDGQFDMGQLPDVLPLLRDYDVISAFRGYRRDGLARELCGAIWTATVDVLLGLRLRDVNCAFKVFPRELLEQVDVQSTGALVDAELLSQVRRLGARIVQVPVRHRPRVAGVQTGAQPAVVLKAVWELLGLLGREKGLDPPAEGRLLPRAR